MKKLYPFIALAIVGCSDTDNSYQGYIEGDYTYLSSPFGGKVTSILAKRGEHIKKGMKLAVLDSNPESLNKQQSLDLKNQSSFQLKNMAQTQRQVVIDEFIAKKDQAIAELSLAEDRLERNTKLYKKRVLDKDSYQASISRVAQLKALIKQFSAQIANAKLSVARKESINAQKSLLKAKKTAFDIANWQLQQKTLYAPYNAEVVDIFYRIGEYATSTKPVLSLLKATNKHLLFFIPEPKLSSLKLGEVVELNCEGCKKDLTASISYIAPYAEYTPPLVYSRKNNPKLVYKVRAKLNQPAYFHPGQPITVNVRESYGG